MGGEKNDEKKRGWLGGRRNGRKRRIKNKRFLSKLGQKPVNGLHNRPNLSENRHEKEGDILEKKGCRKGEEGGRGEKTQSGRVWDACYLKRAWAVNPRRLTWCGRNK